MPVHLLVPMDGSPLSKRALEHACSMHPDARTSVLYVIEGVEESYVARALVGAEELRERGEARAATVFEEARAIADGHDVGIDTEVAVGEPAREIVAYAEDHDVDQIVIGGHGRSPPSRVLLGSVAHRVTRRAPVPVTVVR
jgi:nucleotide-binding universal stress UspA family protein